MARYATYALITLCAIVVCRASDGHQVVRYHVKRGTHVPYLRARERAKAQWESWLSSTFFDSSHSLFVHVLRFHV